MKNSHERLENLINYFSNPSKKTGGLLIPGRETFKTMFTDETWNIRCYLKQRALEIEDEKRFEFLVHQYQSQIAAWLDELIAPGNQKNRGCPNRILEFMVKELEKLLWFIYTRYESFFNLDERVPQISLGHFRQAIKEKLPKLRNHLMMECNNEALVELALMPLKKLVHWDPKRKFTYRQLVYSMKVEKALSDFKNEKYTGSTWENKALIELLVWHNYNHPETTPFIVNTIIANEKPESDENKLARLRFYVKEFKQFKEQPNMAFNKNHSSLRDQLITWISDEITFMTRADLPPSSTAIPGKNNPNETKLKLNLPVGVIALLGRAAKDMNVIADKSNKEIFTDFSETLSSKNTEKLSVNSLIRKSYPTESKSKSETIDLLHEMIKRIHKY